MEIITFDKHRLVAGGAGILLVLGSTVLYNTFKEMDALSLIPFVISLCAFAIGWIILAAVLVHVGMVSRNLGVLISIGCISLSTITTIIAEYLKIDLGAAKSILTAVYVLGWLALGFFVGEGLNPHAKILGILGAVTVLLGQTVILPVQREEGVVDGPGLPLYTLGLGLLTLANADLD
jgi:hypothetical protein